MIVLDTDSYSILQSGRGLLYDNLVTRLNLTTDQPWVTIVTVEEQFRGRLAQISRSRSVDELVDRYERLRTLMMQLSQRPVMTLDYAAAKELQRLKLQRIRIGTLDLRIAAIALSREALLISRNLRDFRRVPELNVEDWTAKRR